MSYQITQSQMMKFAPLVPPALSAQLVNAINEVASKYGIDQQPRRLRYFISQSFFETQGFTRWVENLVYTTPERLCVVWSDRFTMNKNDHSKAYAPDYVNNSMKLANLTYANRYGNGNEASGDGFRFRGRGGFHLTFRDNYAEYSQDLYGDNRIVLNPDLVLQPEDAMMSAGHFWNKKGLSAYADSDSFTMVTKIINGSTDTVPLRLPVLTLSNAAFSW